ncbi:MAG: hypothetical protein AAGI68_07440 [Planctomycetota bacterium]
MPRIPRLKWLAVVLALALYPPVTAEDAEPVPQEAPPRVGDIELPPPPDLPDNPDIHQLASAALVYYEQNQDIRARSLEASAETRKEYAVAQARIRALSVPFPDVHDLNDKQEELAQLESKIAVLRAEIAAGQVRDQVQRDALAAELRPELTRIRQQLTRITTPFHMVNNQLRAQAATLNPPFQTALDPYLKAPVGGPFAHAVPNTTAALQYARFSVTWRKPQNVSVARATIDIRPRPNIPDDAQLLRDKHYVEKFSARNATVWAGHMRINFTVIRRGGQPADVPLLELIPMLIDLDGLAAIDAHQGPPEFALR